MSTHTANPVHPEVSVTLSRPAYRLGGTCVGTIRVTCSAATMLRPRDLLESLSWMVVGQCRLDPRWHNVSNYQKLYQHPTAATKDLGPAADTNSVCFWSTQRIELLELQERQEGKWEDVKPKPIHLPGRKRVLKSNISSSESSFESNELLEDEQLAFTFRFQLPSDLPHSVSATSCRYRYSILVRMQTMANLDITTNQVQWIQVPLTVLTAADSNSDPASATPLTSASSPHTTVTTQGRAVAHSAGLPCHVTVSELHQPAGRLTVNRHGAALFRHVRRQDPRHLQTMQVADPASGQPVAVLTVLGVNRLSPGSRLVLKLDFPRQTSKGGGASSGASSATVDANWLPCFQASACLQGEEVAIHSSGSRTKTRSLLLDTAHERIDPVCTECACLSLMVPLNAPCSIQTSLLEISISIRVDITVGNSSGDGFRNLQLEIPCRVGHGTAAYEEQEDELDERENTFLSASYDDDGEARELDPRDPNSFPIHDIHDDLKILSLSMAGQCGLRPSPAAPFLETNSS